MPEPRAGTTCTCPPPAAGGIVGVNRGHLLGCPALRARSTTRTTVAEPPIPDGLRMAAYRAARDWAAEHRHPQPDDRMVAAALAAAYPLLRAQWEADRADARLLPPGGEISTWWGVLNVNGNGAYICRTREAAEEHAAEHPLEGDYLASRAVTTWGEGHDATTLVGSWFPVVTVAADGAEQMTVERAEARDRQED